MVAHGKCRTRRDLSVFDPTTWPLWSLQVQEILSGASSTGTTVNGDWLLSGCPSRLLLKL